MSASNDIATRRWNPWRHASAGVTGAAVGFLTALAYVAADMPMLHGGHHVAMLWLATGVGACIGLARWGRGAAVAAVIVAAVLALCVGTPILRRPVARWIRRDPLPAAPLDAVVVLSADVNDDGVLNDYGAARLISGLALFKANNAKLLITTRVAHQDDAHLVTSDAGQRALVALAGDTTRWRIVGPTANTHDEALRTAVLLAPASAHAIAVVTSPMHTRRACAIFETLSFHVTCVPSDERRYAVYALPGPYDRLRALYDYVYERLAMIEYRARGWITTS